MILLKKTLEHEPIIVLDFFIPSSNREIYFYEFLAKLLQIPFSIRNYSNMFTHLGPFKVLFLTGVIGGIF